MTLGNPLSAFRHKQDLHRSQHDLQVLDQAGVGNIHQVHLQLIIAGPFLICGDGGEDLISLTDSQITKYEKKYHSPLIFLELYPKPITLKCTPELYAKCMGEEHQHDTQGNEHDER